MDGGILPWQLRVGWRFLRARRSERFVSVIGLIAGGGVAIGVMTLCIVLAVMTGFEQDLRDRGILRLEQVELLVLALDRFAEELFRRAQVPLQVLEALLLVEERRVVALHRAHPPRRFDARAPF